MVRNLTYLMCLSLISRRFFFSLKLSILKRKLKLHLVANLRIYSYQYKPEKQMSSIAPTSPIAKLDPETERQILGSRKRSSSVADLSEDPDCPVKVFCRSPHRWHIVTIFSTFCSMRIREYKYLLRQKRENWMVDSNSNLRRKQSENPKSYWAFLKKLDRKDERIPLK